MGEMGSYWRDFKEHKKAQKAKRAAREAAQAEKVEEPEETSTQQPQKAVNTNLPTENEKPKKKRRRRKAKKPAEPAESAKPTKPAKQPERRRCWDWIVSSGNVHYAKNRSSFKSYRHISLEVQTSNGIIRIIGVGRVELKAKLPESDEISELVLKNVLHVPDALCNGFSPSRLKSSYFERGNNVIGGDKDEEALCCVEEFHGLSRLVLEGNPQGESPLAQAEQNSKLGFNLSLSLEEKDRLRLPHMPKSSTIAKDSPEPSSTTAEAAVIKEQRPIEDLLRRNSDSDEEWVIDDYDSDGSEQEGTKVGHPYFAKWLQEMTAESLANASKFACSPQVLLNATVKGIHAVTETYKGAKPGLLYGGSSEEKLAKESFKAAFDSEMYRALSLNLPTK